MKNRQITIFASKAFGRIGRQEVLKLQSDDFRHYVNQSKCRLDQISSKVLGQTPKPTEKFKDWIIRSVLGAEELKELEFFLENLQLLPYLGFFVRQLGVFQVLRLCWMIKTQI
jgi:hypothetical protein